MFYVRKNMNKLAFEITCCLQRCTQGQANMSNETEPREASGNIKN